jgi:hypothetical protein
VGRERII